jgi:hypothetical protein
MKKLVYISLIFLTSCTSDFDIIYDHPSVPVIYCVIDPRDTIHYARVQKTFVINEKEDWNNLNLDSLQYKDVEVNLYGKKENEITWKERFIEAECGKEDGFFPPGEYQYFVIDHKLPIVYRNPDRNYYGFPDTDSLILEIIIHDIGIISRASAKVLKAGKIINYKSPNLIYVYGGKPSVFATPNPGEYFEGKAYSDAYQQIEFKVHYKEHLKDNSSAKEILWSTHNGWDGNAYFITPERLFNPIKLRLSKSDSVLSRTLDSIDIEILKPSRFFNNYWFVRDYWEDSDRPPYTNFDNSYGMFFTITIGKQTGMTLDFQSMDSLCNGYYYREMKFKKW